MRRTERHHRRGLSRVEVVTLMVVATACIASLVLLAAAPTARAHRRREVNFRGGGFPTDGDERIRSRAEARVEERH